MAEGNLIILEDHRPVASKAFKDAWFKELQAQLEVERLEDEAEDKRLRKHKPNDGL